MRGTSRIEVALLAAIIGMGAAGCRIREADDVASAAGGTGQALRGRITIDGSSTVYPITQAVAEEFNKVHPRVEIPVGLAGTGGGFKRFIGGGLDICCASRPIDPEEIESCGRNGVAFLELRIATDGLTIVVNARNTWCTQLTVEQLKAIWESGSTIKRWDQIDPSFPRRDLILYGPDTDSGTFDYFTEAICKQKGNSRTDYTSSSNDNILVQGVKGDEGALGYFGFAYYVLNASAMKAVAIAPAEGKPAVAATEDSILDGRYVPLARPLFLYVNKSALKQPAVTAFLEFYFTSGESIVKEVHYLPLTAAQRDRELSRLKQASSSP